MLFLRIKAHYRSVARQLSLDITRPRQGMRHHMLVLAPDIHKGVIPALQYARYSLPTDVKALHVSINPTREQSRARTLDAVVQGHTVVVVLPSPYRSLIEPLMSYINHLQAQEPNSIITLVIPNRADRLVAQTAASPGRADVGPAPAFQTGRRGH